MSGSNGKSSSPVKPLNAARVERLQFEHTKADDLTRKVQDFRRRAGVPAINELRYSGYHLVSALTATNEDEKEEHLTSAINHCRRASYEACESGVMTALDRISIFKNDYKRVVISDCVPDWIEILQACENFKANLSKSRIKGEDRGEDHEEHMEAFDYLVDVCGRLDAARQELNKKIALDARQTQRYTVATVIAIFGVLIAILALIPS